MLFGDSLAWYNGWELEELQQISVRHKDHGSERHTEKCVVGWNQDNPIVDKILAQTSLISPRCCLSDLRLYKGPAKIDGHGKLG